MSHPDEFVSGSTASSVGDPIAEIEKLGEAPREDGPADGGLPDDGGGRPSGTDLT